MSDLRPIPSHSGPLYRMFTRIPQHYDRLNRILTWGLDERWRKRAARECLAARPRIVLDLGCGTGDLALHLARRAGDEVQIVGADFCGPMLEVARGKAQPLARGKPYFVLADVASLPFATESIDCVGTSFALRNLTYNNPLRQQYLAEVFRILRPGGRWVLLETSQPRSRLVRSIYHFYLQRVVPGAGGLLSREKGAYRYLGESAARFGNASKISEMLRAAGFRQVTCRPLLLSVAAIHLAVK